VDNPRTRRALANRWDSVPSLETIRVFAAVAELKSFRGAGAALGLPRSTVSRRLSDLEDDLGTRLLQRSTRSVSLTSAGELFLSEISPALQQLGDASRRIVDSKKEPHGLIRLTATASMAERIGAIMLDLLETYSELRVELDFTDRNVDLVAEGYDLAVRAGKLADSSLVARQLPAARHGYYVSPGYAAGAPRLTHPSQLVEHPCVVFSGLARGARWTFEIEGKPIDVPVRGRVIANSIAVARLAALRGVGVTWLPTPVAQTDVEEERLIPVLKKFWLPPVPIQLVYPSARMLAPQVRVAIEALVDGLTGGKYAVP
jgi:DNA-binding transcriptional LysR family regulator